MASERQGLSLVSLGSVMAPLKRSRRPDRDLWAAPARYLSRTPTRSQAVQGFDAGPKEVLFRCRCAHGETSIGPLVSPRLGQTWKRPARAQQRATVSPAPPRPALNGERAPYRDSSGSRLRPFRVPVGSLSDHSETGSVRAGPMISPTIRLDGAVKRVLGIPREPTATRRGSAGPRRRQHRCCRRHRYASAAPAGGSGGVTASLWSPQVELVVRGRRDGDDSRPGRPLGWGQRCVGRSYQEVHVEDASGDSVMLEGAAWWWPRHALMQVLRGPSWPWEVSSSDASTRSGPAVAVDDSRGRSSVGAGSAEGE